MNQYTAPSERARKSVSCANCAKTFEKHLSAIHKNQSGQFYCTRECMYAWRRRTGQHPIPQQQRLTIHCETCGKAVKVRPSKADQRFCSQECMLVWRAPVLRAKRHQPDKHTIRACEWCGTKFKTHRCRIKDGRGRFCSRACVGARTASMLEKRVSKLEKRFASDLQQVGLTFETQYRAFGFVVDIAFPEQQLAVEVDGDYWHSLPKVKKADATKNKRLSREGWTVLRIPESLINSNRQAAIQSVVSALT